MSATDHSPTASPGIAGPHEANDRLPKSQHQWRNISIALVLVVVAGAAAWYFGRANERGGGKGRPAAAVGTAKVAVADVPVTLNAIGSVQPVVAATVRTQLPGTLFSLNFAEGQMVSKGQLLAQIDPRPYRLALNAARADLQRDEAQLDIARADLDRYQLLLSQDSIARQQVNTQVATVKQLEGTIEADRAAVGTATLNLNYTAIVAPVAGRTGLRQADIGNYLTPGDATGIVVITQTMPIDVSFSVPQNQLPDVQAQLASGRKLPVAALDQSGARVLANGEFLTFDNQIDATSGTLRAKARFANQDGNLFPNQFVNVVVTVDTLRNAVTVPVASVRHGAQGDFVFVLQPDKTVKLQTVKSGSSDGKQIVITEGVAAGETVITEGADSLDDGSRITLPGAARKQDAADGNVDRTQHKKKPQTKNASSASGQ